MHLITFFCILIVCINNSFAEQNKAFKERAEIYSRLTACDYYQTDEYNYTHFVELSKLKDAQSSDYLARVPVYVIGPGNAHILFSATNEFNQKGSVYEILIGGYGNSKTLIRKKIDNFLIQEIETPNIASDQRPLKVFIEIAKGGSIRIYTDNKAKPLLEAFDPFTLDVKYLSFASYQGASNEFLCNCVSDKTTLETSNDINTKPVSYDPDNLSTLPINELAKKCRMYDSFELQYNSFFSFDNMKNSKSDGYLFKMSFFALAKKEIHVLLSQTDEKDPEKVPAYEIVIGGYGNTRQIIRKTAGDELFEKVQLKDLITPDQPTRVLIQLSKDGLLEVFVGEVQYKPVIQALDPKPIKVIAASFASNDGTRILYFIDCDDKKAAAALAPKPAPHPLYAEPIEQNEETLKSKCKHLRAWEDKYETLIKLDSIKNSKTDEYLAQFVFYVKGSRDAHILLTSDGLNRNEGYEIVIGGWGNSKNLIRKHGEVVAKTNEYNVLSEFKTIKVIVQLSKNGDFRVYTDGNKSKPLLEFKDNAPIKNLSAFSFTAYYRDLDFYYGCTA